MRGLYDVLQRNVRSRKREKTRIFVRRWIAQATPGKQVGSSVVIVVALGSPVHQVSGGSLSTTTKNENVHAYLLLTAPPLLSPTHLSPGLPTHWLKAITYVCSYLQHIKVQRNIWGRCYIYSPSDADRITFEQHLDYWIAVIH